MDLHRSFAFGLLVWRLVRVKKNLLTHTLEDREAVLTTNVPASSAPNGICVYACGVHPPKKRPRLAKRQATPPQTDRPCRDSER